MQHWWISAAALIGVALLGLVVSLRIARLRPANPSRRFPLNAVGQTVARPGHAGGQPALLLAALASAFYWFLAAASQVNIDRLVTVDLGMDQQYVSHLLAALAVGVGLGTRLAGVWSAGKIELGMVPWAAAGMAVSCLLLFFVPAHAGTRFGRLPWSCLGLLALGFSAGFFDVPLQAFLQHRSPPQSRGRSWQPTTSSPSPACCWPAASSGSSAKSSGFRPANLPLRRPGHAAGGPAQPRLLAVEALRFALWLLRGWSIGSASKAWKTSPKRAGLCSSRTT